MSIFHFSNYRDYLSAHIKSLPHGGRGEITRIAKALNVQSTVVSMVFSGSRDFSIEQAMDLSVYLQHTDIEAEYFLLMVQIARASHHKLKMHFQKRLKNIQKEANKIENRFEHEKKLSEHDRAVFYSSWIYSAVRLFASLTENGKTLPEIMDRFDLPRARALGILEFLKSTGLIIENQERYQMGISRTYLEQGSPHLPRHHMNWRLKSLQKSDRISESELMFTFPMSLSREDFLIIRDELSEVLKKVSKIVKDSPPDDIACLNIDLFWLEK